MAFKTSDPSMGKNFVSKSEHFGTAVSMNSEPVS